MSRTISSSYASGITLSSPGDNPVTVTGTINASSGSALYGTSPTAWTVTNSGQIDASGTSGYGIRLRAGGSVTNLSGGTITSAGYEGVYIDGGGTIINSGSISASHHNANGVIIQGGGGAVTNQYGGNITGLQTGVQVQGGTGTVTNYGDIAATQDWGVFLFNGGAVTNQANATISGLESGIKIASDTGTVINAGAISGQTQDGIVLSFGNVTNQAGGTITGNYAGIFNYSFVASTVVNAGSIGGTTYAVLFRPGHADSVVVDPGAVFTGTVDGGNTIGAAYASTLELASGASAGTLNSLGTQYINFANITIDSGATWTLASDSLGAGYTIYDSGTLTNTGSLGSTVTLGANAVLANATTGTINSGDGIHASGTAAVTNAGHIYGYTSSGVGVFLDKGGSVTNQQSGTISALYGVWSQYGGATIENAGSLYGLFEAVKFHAGYNNLLKVDPGASFTGLVNGANAIGSTYVSTLELASGTIAGTLSGLGSQYFDFANITIDSGANWTLASDTLGSGYTIDDSGTLTNTGSLGSTVTLTGGAVLTNAASGTIAATGYGVTGQGTLDNAGSIIGASGTAVALTAGYANRVEMAPSAYFGGTVDGGNTIGATYVSTLELASGASIGTLSGLGSQYVDFGQVTVDQGATWTLSDPIGSGVTLTNNGTIDGQVSLSGGAYLTNASTGTISAIGSDGVYASGGAVTVANAGSIYGSNHYGVRLSGGGLVLNQDGGTIGGSKDGIVIAGAAGTVINAGGIAGLTQYGVALLASGSALTNQSGGTITGHYQGVDDQGSSATLVNAGSITGNIGVFMPNGGILANQSGGEINGSTGQGVLVSAPGTVINAGSITGIFGIEMRDGAGTLINAGYIGGSSKAVQFGSGYYNRLVVDPGATFSGAVDGRNTIGATIFSTLELASGASTGTLSNLGSQFVNFANITIDSGATWTLASDTLGAGYTIIDSGTLTNTGSLGSAVYLGNYASLINLTGATITGSRAVYATSFSAGTIVNQSGALIEGSNYGLKLADGGPVINGGSIYATNATSGVGVYLGDGYLTNQSSGTISGEMGVFSYEDGTVVNAGLIESTGTTVRYGKLSAAVYVGTGSVTNQAGGMITASLVGVESGDGAVVVNAGTITAGYGVDVVGGGSVTNLAGGAITGSTFAVSLYESASSARYFGQTLVNAGSIFGVVTLSAGATNRLVVDPGAYFSTTVDGGNTLGATHASTLELASGTIAGTLSNFGSQFYNFANITIDSGATWTLASDTIGAGYTIDDSGTLTNIGSLGVTVTLTGGALINAASATIATSGYAVTGEGTVDNAGSIIGGSGTAVALTAGYTNRVAIAPGAYFGGTVDGGNTIGATYVSTLELASGASAATLSGLGSQYVDFGQVTVDQGATWTLNGPIASGVTLANNGTIEGPVSLTAGAYLTNASTGTISGIGSDPVDGYAGPVTVANAGLISNFGADGLRLLDGGFVVNQVGGTISAGFNAIYVGGTAGTIINAGIIAGLSQTGIDLFKGGAVTNQSSGTITGDEGIHFQLDPGIVVNAGQITGSSQGIYLVEGGDVTNQSGGDISGGSLQGVLIHGGTVFNAGSITGATGVQLTGAGTVINAGYIGGTSGTAVYLANNYTNRLVVDPGATFSGAVNGRNTIGSAYVSTLELASGASAGTLSGLGTQYINFANITIDSGATWTLASDSLGAAYTIYDSGTLTNTGSLGSTVTLGANAVLTNAMTGTINSGDGIHASGTATVTNAGHIYGYTSSGVGVFLDEGGSVTNQQSGTISALYGVWSQYGGATIENAGSLYGLFEAVKFHAGYNNLLKVDPGASFTGLVNGANTIGATYVSTLELASGTIAGTLSGLGSQYFDFANITIDSGANWTLASDTLGSGYTIYDSGTLTNTGSLGSTVTLTGGALINPANATIATAGYAVTGQGAVDNAGSLIGGSGTAVALTAGYANRVEMAPSAYFGGIVDGGNTIGATSVSTLELASGASAATLSGLGSQYVDFGQVTVDQSATWALNDPIASGVTLTNNGTIDGRVLLTGGAYLTNASTGTISAGGRYAVAASGGTVTVANAGNIYSPGNFGVWLLAGGLVLNQGGGTIGGASDGIYAENGATVVNAGRITSGSGTSDFGVYLEFGGAVTNQSSGDISSGYWGVLGAFNPTVINAGTITGKYGVELRHGSGTLINAGYIAGTAAAVVFHNYAGNLLVVDPGATFSGAVNGGNTIGAAYASTLELASAASAGTLSGLGSQFTDFGNITIDTGATWTLASDTLGAGYKIYDSGTLTNTGSLGSTVTLGAGAYLANASGATIASGGLDAVYGAAAGAATVVNAGYLSGGNYGVSLADGGVITNQASATIIGDRGVQMGDVGTVVNAGSIYGVSSNAVQLNYGGSVTNQAGGTIVGYQGVGMNGPGTVVNDGGITGNGPVGFGVVLVDGGSVTNQADGTITGPHGVAMFTDAGTVVNAGVISGGAYDAVTFASGFANLLVIDPGAVFNGTVDGGNTLGATSVSTIELASGTIAGTLSGLGSQYIDFANITIDNGATWTLASPSLGAGYTIDDSGTLTNTGSLGSTVTLTGGALINAANATIATSGYAVTGQGAVDNAGSLIGGSGTAVALSAGYANRVAIVAGAYFGGIVDGGNTIGATSVSTLELASGASAATLSGLGSQYIDFGQVTVDQGATWTLNDPITSGVTLANNGTIDGEVTLAGGAYLTNASTGTISVAGATAVRATSDGVTVVNAGSIAGSGPGYVVNLRNALVINESGGIISNPGFGAVYVVAGTVVNDGVMSADNVDIFLKSGGSATNQSGGTLAGNPAAAGIFAENGAATVVNAGSIGGSTGIALQQGGFVTNAAGGSVDGTHYGVQFRNASGTLTNAGSIAGTNDAVLFAGGYSNLLVVDPGASFTGTVNGGNAPGGAAVSALELASGASYGTLSGLGTQFINFSNVTIDAGATWTLTAETLGAGYTIYDSGTLTNTGSLGSTVTLTGGGVLANAASATIATSGYAVTGQGTVINDGGITGGSGTAVSLSAGFADRVAIAPGAYFGGTVDGGNTIGAAYVSTLELTTGSGIGTLTGLGTQFIDFGQVTVDPGANWVLSGYNSLAAGMAFVVDSSLSNTGTLAGAVTLASGAYLYNAATASIIGNVLAFSGSATVVNAGLIDPAVPGVYLAAGGSVTNLASGTIESTENGVLINGGIGTVDNYGSIIATAADGMGVELLSSSTVVNQSGGVIYGGGIGVYARSTSTVENAGSITGGTFAVTFASGYAGDRLVVDPGAYFAGTVDGGNTIGATYASTLELASSASIGTLSHLGSQIVDFAQITVDQGATWTLDGSITSGVTLTNNGTIDGEVSLTGGAYLTNASTGTISASSKAAVYASGGAVTLANAGSIYDSNYAGVLLQDGGLVVNQLGGTISGNTVAIYSLYLGAAATVINAGSIASQYGIALFAGGAITNQSSGTIAGQKDGIWTDNQPSTVVNAGRITGSAGVGFGVYLNSGGAVTNQSGGTISGGKWGVLGQNGATVINAGTITGKYGVELRDTSGTLINAGYIAGTVAAVLFHSYAGNRLVVDPGATFSGAVNGGNTIGATNVSTLELASGASAGTLSGLGSQFYNFAQTTIDPGATWYLDGSNTLVAGATLLSSGTLIDAGAFTNQSTIGFALTLANAAYLTNASGATITGSSGQVGVFGIYDGIETVVNAGYIAGASGQYGVFLSGGGSVTNLAGGTIVGYQGVQVGLGGPGTVVNAGSIYGTVGNAIQLQSGGSVTNEAGGTIVGPQGVELNAAGTVINYGGITANGHGEYGVALYDGGSVTNQAGGTIAGYHGVVVHVGASTVVNAGVISGAYTAIRLASGYANRLVFDPGAVFNGTVDGGNTIGAAYTSTLELASASSVGTLNGLGSQFINFANVDVDIGATWTLTASPVYGTLTNAGTIGSEITLAPGATLTNKATGTIAPPSGYYAIYGTNAGPATVVNYGDIGSGVASTAIQMQGGGAITNLSGGIISGSAWGVSVNNGAGTVVNAGSISGNVDGIELYGGGVVTNESGGSIYGGNFGLYVYNGAGTLTNAGTISSVRFEAGFNNRLVVDPGASFSGNVDGGNTLGATVASTLELASGTIAGTLSGLGSKYYNFSQLVVDPGATWIFDPSSAFAGTLTNAGTIGGSIGSTPGVVQFAYGYPDRLIMDPGASFNATVNGGNTLGATAASTLELASGATAGTLSGLGSQYSNFSNITIDSGATWTLASDTLGAGYTINDSGTLTNTGVIGSPVTLGSGAVLTNASGALITTRTGDAVYETSATLFNDGNISAADAAVHMYSGTFVNQANGVATGYTAIGSDGGSPTVVNYGRLGNNSARFGLEMLGAALVTNQSGGVIAGNDAGITTGLFGGAGTVVNAGRISSYGNSFAYYSGLSMLDGGYVDNQSSGVISGALYGVSFRRGPDHSGAAGTLVNAGTIDGGTGAVEFGAGYTNRLTIDPGASFSGAVNGANAIGAAYVSTLELASGTIAGTLSGLGSQYFDFANVTIDSGATWTLASDTLGTGYTIYDSGTLTNTGSLGSTVTLTGGALINPANATIATAGYAVTGQGAVDNAGSLIGGSGTAVALTAGYANRVAIVPGSYFGGIVDGGNTIGATSVSTLELASGASAATLSGLGSQYVDFGQVTVDQGATWALNDPIASGVTLANNGTINGEVELAGGAYLTNASTGTINAATSDDAVFASGGPVTVVNAGAISGPNLYGIKLTAGGTVINQTGGSLSGRDGAIYIGNAPGTVINAGQIQGSDIFGVFLQSGGAVTNQTGGNISGSDWGVVTNGGATVFNAGSITSGQSGVDLRFASSTVINAGYIAGHVAAVL